VVPGSVIFHFINTHSININYKVNKSNKVSLQKEKAFVKGPFYKGLVFPQVNEVWPCHPAGFGLGKAWLIMVKSIKSGFIGCT
jgi:hypothetical protein